MARNLRQPVWEAMGTNTAAIIHALRGETTDAESFLARAESMARPIGARAVLADANRRNGCPRPVEPAISEQTFTCPLGPQVLTSIGSFRNLAPAHVPSCQWSSTAGQLTLLLDAPSNCRVANTRQVVAPGWPARSGGMSAKRYQPSYEPAFADRKALT